MSRAAAGRVPLVSLYGVEREDAFDGSRRREHHGGDQVPGARQLADAGAAHDAFEDIAEGCAVASLRRRRQAE
jgi:hypothetical protein